MDSGVLLHTNSGCFCGTLAKDQRLVLRESRHQPRGHIASNNPADAAHVRMIMIADVVLEIRVLVRAITQHGVVLENVAPEQLRQHRQNTATISNQIIKT